MILVVVVVLFGIEASNINEDGDEFTEYDEDDEFVETDDGETDECPCRVLCLAAEELSIMCNSILVFALS